jgi:hypothetical protein
MTPTHPSNEDELIERMRSIDVPAPPSLRASVERMIADASAAPHRPLRALLARTLPRRDRSGARTRVERRALGAGLAGAALAVAAILAVVLASSGGTHASLTLRDAAAPTLLASTAPAPRERAHTGFLAAAVERVSFPYWEESFGWHSSGARHDVLRGRAVTTIFYTHDSARIGYAIYAGVPAPRTSGGSVRTRGHTPYRVSSGDGIAIISWQRGGHLCVMSSRSASISELIRLAAWGDGVRAA